MIEARLFQNWTKKALQVSFALMFTLLSSAIFAQVKGVITDAATGEPLIGASVLVKGTAVGTVTGLDGDFSLNAKEGDVLQISYTGFTSIERTVGSDLMVNVSLEQGVALDEVVVTGYQSLRKRDISGAVAVIKSDDLKNIVASSFAQKLQGRATGVTVSTSGSPGDATNVRIRGISSFNNNDPLYVIDGLPVQDKGNLNINPSDIESMQVLKDASTASIYGSRASNGVIVITTKQGKAGKTKVSYNGSISSASSVKGWDDILITSGAEYLDMTKQFFTNGNQALPTYATGGSLPTYIYVDPALNGGVSVGNTVDESKYDRYTNPIMKTSKEGTNWWDVITRTALTNDHNLTVSGGTDKSRFLVSGGILEQEGVLQYNKFSRASLRINSSFDVSKRIRIGENFNLARRNVFNSVAQSEQGTLSQVYKIAPILPVYDIGTSVDPIDGTEDSFGGSKSANTGNAGNPLAQLYRGRRNFNKNLNILGNIWAEADVIKDLTFKTQLNTDFNNANSRAFRFRTPENQEDQGAQNFNENWSNGFTWTWTNTLGYKLALGEKHKISALAGYEAIKGDFRNINGSVNDYFSTDPNIWYLNPAFGNAGTRQVGSSGSENSLVSTFGKLDYSFNDQLFLSGTIRRDGSSRFAPEFKYGVFPAFSAAYRLSSLPFLKDNALVSDLKVRASWGKTGNQSIGDYNYFDRYGGNIGSAFYAIDGSNSAPAVGYHQTAIGNYGSKWEEAVSSNFGLDASLLNDKLTVVFDVWQRKTNDLLYPAPLAGPIAGFKTIPFRNIAAMQNNGIDLGLGYKGSITNDLKFSVDLNLSHYKNKITQVNEGATFFYPSSQQGRIDNRLATEININQVGFPISSFRGYTVDGIFNSQAELDALDMNGKTIGGLRFKDLNGDKKINDADLGIIGSPHPDLVAGLNLGVDYKNWNVNAFINGSFGNEIFNYVKIFTHFRQFFSNVDREYYLNNGKNGTPKLNASDAGSRQASTYYVEDGSYVRLGQLQIGYNLPKATAKKFGMSNLKLYVQGQNLFTITKYSGLDPALSNANIGDGRNLNDIWMGFDIGQYPSNKLVSFGVQVDF